jgi:hypothetical protein
MPHVDRGEVIAADARFTVEGPLLGKPGPGNNMQPVSDVMLRVLEPSDSAEGSDSSEGSGSALEKSAFRKPERNLAKDADPNAVGAVGSSVTEDLSNLQDAASGEVQWLQPENINIDVLIQLALRQNRKDEQKVQSAYRSLRDQEANSELMSEIQASEQKRQAAFAAKAAAYVQGITGAVQSAVSITGGVVEVGYSGVAAKLCPVANRVRYERITANVRSGNAVNQSMGNVGQSLGQMAGADKQQENQLRLASSDANQTDGKRHGIIRDDAQERKQDAHDYISTSHDVEQKLIADIGDTYNAVAHV